MTDIFNRQWITENAVEICKNYDWGVLTLRALHYQLVARGMTNSIRHYKRVVNAMIKARWEGIVSFNQFSDHDREVLGFTEYQYTELEDSIATGKRQVELWMNSFNRGRWENQQMTPEIWIEKKALQGVFSPVCRELDVALAPCKGYPSLTFLHEAARRFRRVLEEDRTPVVLYFGDYDATGEDIPRSIGDNLFNLGVEVEVRRIALMEEQVLEMGLPPAPTKSTDTRAVHWTGIGQVELDAVDPKILQKMCRDSVAECFDEASFEELKEATETDREAYRAELRDFVNNMF